MLVFEVTENLRLSKELGNAGSVPRPWELPSAGLAREAAFGRDRGGRRRAALQASSSLLSVEIKKAITGCGDGPLRIGTSAGFGYITLDMTLRIASGCRSAHCVARPQRHRGRQHGAANPACGVVGGRVHETLGHHSRRGLSTCGAGPSAQIQADDRIRRDALQWVADSKECQNRARRDRSRCPNGHWAPGLRALRLRTH